MLTGYVNSTANNNEKKILKDKDINNLVIEEQTTTNNKIDSRHREEFQNNLSKILSEYY